MAKLVFGMNQSLAGYVDHLKFEPSPTLFRHFIEEAQGQAGSVYGRTTYGLMRYWDDDQPEWGDPERAFAAAWRKRHMVDVAVQGLVHSEHELGHITSFAGERDGTPQ